MRSLFLKIFLWFWPAMALVGIALAVSVATTRSEPLPDPGREIVNSAMAIYAQTAAEIFERDGQPALADYIERVEKTSHIRAYVFNDRGEELSGQTAPPGAIELAAGAERDHEIKSSSAGILVARFAFTQRARYVLIGELPPRKFPALNADPSAQALRLIAVIITAGIVCYALARYLTAPVVKLRAAARRLADGDLTARVGAAAGKKGDELTELGRDFDNMAEKIELLMIAQRRLLSDISHELRSPLARLNVALELARQRSGAEAKSSLDRIEREAERLNEMIGHLLTLTSLESGAQSVESNPVDLAQLVHEIAEDADFEARSRNRSVRVVRSKDCTTTGDAALLQSAVENIVRNSVRYTAEGTEVEIGLDRQLEGDGHYAVISVRDHGAGVPETALADIFRPFYRIADARDRQTGGVGLGLAITERAVRLHGGMVKATNASDGGLLIEIHLPIDESHQVHKDH